MTTLVKSSLTSRRFPALRTLTGEDVEVFVMPEESQKKKGGGTGDSHLFDPNVVKPSAVGSLGSTRGGGAGSKKAPARPMKERPPFRPNNPSEARETISLWQTGYVELHSPYDLAHRLSRQEVKVAKEMSINPTFIPNAYSQARDSVKVNYFLTSPDAETIEAERRYIKEKAAKNMQEYLRHMKKHHAAISES